MPYRSYQLSSHDAVFKWIIYERGLPEAVNGRFSVNFMKKELPTQVSSCEFCKIFRNSVFVEHLQTAASNIFFLRVSSEFTEVSFLIR